jgi:hypothetical protein
VQRDKSLGRLAVEKRPRLCGADRALDAHAEVIATGAPEAGSPLAAD